MAGPEGNGSDRTDENPQEGQQAEDALEDLGRRVGRFLSSAAARVREEAEDIMAEAQSIRRGERE